MPTKLKSEPALELEPTSLIYVLYKAMLDNRYRNDGFLRKSLLHIEISTTPE
jgi:hypothetical protein